MILVDSNLIIYAASRKYSALTDWFKENKPAVSAISLVETLGYHKLPREDRQYLEAFFAELIIYYPTPEVIQSAIELRQKHAMSLGDALIAATALTHDLTLATHNAKDFAWIKSLGVLDPLGE